MIEIYHVITQQERSDLQARNTTDEGSRKRNILAFLSGITRYGWVDLVRVHGLFGTHLIPWL